jgi:hypothetical protein
MKQSLLILSALAAAWLLARWLDRRRHPRHRKVKDPLDHPLLWLSPSDAFTVRDLLNGGVVILGRTGAGKTTSSGKAFATALIKLGANRT